MIHKGPFLASAQQYGQISIDFYFLSDDKLLITSFLMANEGYEHLKCVMPTNLSGLNEGVEGSAFDHFDAEHVELIGEIQKQAMARYRNAEDHYNKSPDDIAKLYGQELEEVVDEITTA